MRACQRCACAFRARIETIVASKYVLLSADMQTCQRCARAFDGQRRFKTAPRRDKIKGKMIEVIFPFFLGGPQTPRRPKVGLRAAPRAPLGTLLGRPWGSLSRSWAGPAPSRSPKSPSRHAQNVQKARHGSQAEPVLPKICFQCESKNVKKQFVLQCFSGT